MFLTWPTILYWHYFLPFWQLQPLVIQTESGGENGYNDLWRGKKKQYFLWEYDPETAVWLKHLLLQQSNDAQLELKEV